MNVNLTPELEEMVQQKVASGLYSSASEVVHEALRLLAVKDQLEVARLGQVREAIQEGLDSGPTAEWDPTEIKRAGRARRARRAKIGGAV